MTKQSDSSQAAAQETVPVKKKKTLNELLESDNVKKRIEEILGKRSSVFAASIMQITSQSTMLAKADPASILGAAMTAATMDLALSNSLGHAYIVPFNTSVKMPDGSWEKVVKAQFIIGYKGLKQLAMRSGQYKTIHYGEVRKGEVKGRNRLTGKVDFDWIEDDAKRDKLPIVGYFSYYELHNGFASMHYMTVKQITDHGKKYSQTFKANKGNWNDDFESMAIKTVIKLHLNKGEAPISLEMQVAIERDQGIVSVDETGQEFTEYEDVPVKKVEVDHEDERIRTFIANSKTKDDFIQAQGHAKTKEHHKLIEAQAKKYKIKLT